MDHDDAMVGRILSRREALTLAARAGVGLAFGGVFLQDADAALQAKAQKEVKLVASPALTEGPFFIDERLNRSNLIGDTDRPTVANGIPLGLAINIYRLNDGRYAPFEGAMVDIWHADSVGVYSGESHPMNHENTAGQHWLRGYQVTDPDGMVCFQTIFPGWYPGRTTHIHFKVRSANREFTSQFFFDDDIADKVFARSPYRSRDTRQARNEDDGIYRERQVDGTLAGEHLMLDVKSGGKGYAAKFAVALTDANLRSGRF